MFETLKINDSTSGMRAWKKKV